jgi:glutamate 5-kinase
MEPKLNEINRVIKVGSTALLKPDRSNLDDAVFRNICSNATVNDVLVTSGALELGKLDFARRNGVDIETLSIQSNLRRRKLTGRGQGLLIEKYRKFFPPEIGVEQLLVEHRHFNDRRIREELRRDLLSSANENSITIVNYNDRADIAELRKLEIEEYRRQNGEAVDLTDNDETAVEVAKLVNAKSLIILSERDGIYRDKNDESTLVREIGGRTVAETLENIAEIGKFCQGASRVGANGAGAKLRYCADAIAHGIDTVFLAGARSNIRDIGSGRAKSTRIAVENSQIR